MKKLISCILVFVLIAALAAPAGAEEPLFLVDGNTVTVRDDGTDQVFEPLIFRTTGMDALADAGGLRLSIDELIVRETKAMNDMLAETYDAQIGDVFLLVRLTLRVKNIGADDLFFDPGAALLVTSEGEQVGCFPPQTSLKEAEYLVGAEQAGTLVFKCANTSAEALTGFRLRMPFPTDERGQALDERIDLHFELDRDFLVERDPVLTEAQQLAVWRARYYYNSIAYSRQGLIEFLSPSCDEADAVVAVDYLGYDWNAEAVRRARSYMEAYQTTQSDGEGMITLLTEFAKFTEDEARFAVQELGLRSNSARPW